MSGSVLLINGSTTPSGTPAGNAIAAGTYSPETSFNNLLGCPLNGLWKLRITDFLGADDGYVFGWGLNFNPSGVQSFTSAITSQSWMPSISITQTYADTITVKPNTIGANCYTLEVIDSFNCNYFTTKCVTVIDTGICSSITTSINNKKFNELVKIYPNPNNGFFVLESPTKSNITVHNTVGVLVYSEELMPSEKHFINLSKEAKGIYFLKIYDENKHYTSKLIIQ